MGHRARDSLHDSPNSDLLGCPWSPTIAFGPHSCVLSISAVSAITLFRLTLRFACTLQLHTPLYYQTILHRSSYSLFSNLSFISYLFAVLFFSSWIPFLSSFLLNSSFFHIIHQILKSIIVYHFAGSNEQNKCTKLILRLTIIIFTNPFPNRFFWARPSSPKLELLIPLL